MLFVFKVCAEVNSFSKASQIMGVKQPAISYSIRKLEDILNVKLFDRGTYGINLTDEGKISITALDDKLCGQKLSSSEVINMLSIKDDFACYYWIHQVMI